MGSLLSQRVGQSPPTGVEPLPTLPRHDLFRNGLPSPSTSATRSLHADEEVKSFPLEMATAEAGPGDLLTPELGDQTANLSLSFPLSPSNKPPPSSSSLLPHPPPIKEISHQRVSRTSTPDSSKATSSEAKPKHQRKTSSSSSTTLPSVHTSTATTKKMFFSKAYKQPISIPIHIVPSSERHNLPYTTTTSVDPPSAHAFTLHLLPRTRIKELCLQAAAYLNLQAENNAAPSSSSSSSSTRSSHPSAEREGDADADADADNNTTTTTTTNTIPSIKNRFEARDRDGHAFDGTETVSEALLAGEPVFLLERGDDVEVLRDLRAEAARRSTPSVFSASSPARSCSRSSSVATGGAASAAGGVGVGIGSGSGGGRGGGRGSSVAGKRGARTASRSRSRARSEPKKTPSQRALEIAMRGASSSTASSEASRGRAPFAGGVSSRASSMSVDSGARRASSPRQQQGEGVPAEIVDTIEDSPSPPPFKLRKRRGSVHRSAKEENGEDDLHPLQQKPGEEADKVSERLTRAIKNPPPAGPDTPKGVVASQQSQQSLPSPASSPSLAPHKFNSQLSIPDSQDPPTPSPPSPASVVQQSRADLTAVQHSSGDGNATMAGKSKRDIISLSPELGDEERRAPPAKTAHTHPPNNAQKNSKAQQPAPAPTKPQPSNSPFSSMRPSSSFFLRDMLPPERPRPRPRPPNSTGKPDPYEIITDDEVQSPRVNSIMRSSVRRLGSGSKSAPSATPAPVTRNSLLVARTPLVSSTRASRIAEDAIIPSTPPRQTPKRTPAVRTGPSSSPVPLPSSPTNLVAAVLSRDSNQSRPKPYREYVVIDESDLEADAHADESILNDAQGRFSSSQQPRSQTVDETALPWTAPPLRLGLDEDSFWPVRAVGRRASVFGGEGARRTAEERDERADIRKLVELDKKNAVGMMGTNISFSEQESRIETGPRLHPPEDNDAQLKTPKRLTRDKMDNHAEGASHMTSSKSPVILIHDSSSSQEGAEEIGWIECQEPLPAPDEVDSSSPKEPIIQAPRTQNGSDGVRRDLTQSEGNGKGRDSWQTAGCSSQEMAVLETPSDPMDDDDAKLPILHEPAIIDPNSDQVKIQYQKKHSTPVATPKTDPIIETTDEEPPTSAQASKRMNLQIVEEPGPTNDQKRKREPSEESDPDPDSDPDADAEDERRRRKRIRREERHAKRVEKRRLREEEEAQREAERIRLEEERKRLALERAHKRAKELEIIVSSPMKAAKMGLVLSETEESDSNQDEEADGAEEASSDLPREQLIMPSSLERSDNSDPLSSREDNGKVSWRALSKKHFSTSPQATAGGAPLSVSTSTAPRLFQQEAPTEGIVVKQEEREPPKLQRTHFDEWAFLETTLGRNGYSPVDMHNRIHLSMMNASIRGMGQPAEEPADETVVMDTIQETPTEAPTEIKLKEKKSKKKARRSRMKSISPSQTLPPAHEEEEDGNPDTTSRSIRSATPSPKAMAVAPAQESKEIHVKSKSGLKQQVEGRTSTSTRARTSSRRKTKDAARKKKFRIKKGHSAEESAWRLLQQQRNKRKK